MAHAKLPSNLIWSPFFLVSINEISAAGDFVHVCHSRLPSAKEEFVGNCSTLVFVLLFLFCENGI